MCFHAAEEWFGPFYEENVEDTGNMFNAQEFDEVYSTYVDAK